MSDDIIKLVLYSYIRTNSQLIFKCSKNDEPNYELLIEKEEDIKWFGSIFNIRGIKNLECKIVMPCNFFIHKVDEGKYVTRNQETGEDCYFFAELIKGNSECELNISKNNS